MKVKKGFFSGMRGRIGNILARIWKNRTYFSTIPSFPKNREFSEQQIAHQDRFRDAAFYAKAVMKEDSLRMKYEPKADKLQLTVYNVAIRDFFRPPKIKSINADQYSGKPDDEIVIRAIDDVEVARVHVVLKKNGEVVEEGDAVRDKFNATLWRHSAKAENDVSGTTIDVCAYDLPGHVTKKQIEL
jgi:hypothetical protein